MTVKFGVTIILVAEKFRGILGLQEKELSLKNLSEKLGIENPQVHRALSEAITTAKCYLELLKMDQKTQRNAEDIF